MKLSKRARHGLETIEAKTRTSTGKEGSKVLSGLTASGIEAFIEPCEGDELIRTLRSLVRLKLIRARRDGTGPGRGMKVGDTFSFRESYFCRITPKGEAALLEARLIEGNKVPTFSNSLPDFSERTPEEVERESHALIRDLYRAWIKTTDLDPDGVPKRSEDTNNLYVRCRSHFEAQEAERTVDPKPGTAAHTARLMAQAERHLPAGDRTDWDAWKEDMKEGGRP